MGALRGRAGGFGIGRQLGAALLAAAAVSPAAAAGAGELKPKFGDIRGIVYEDVSGKRDACLAALERKIHLCRLNADFASDAKNREHAACLPVFRRQVQGCVEHFTRARSRCDGPGRVQVPDFTGFGCEAAKTTAGKDAAPEPGTGAAAPTVRPTEPDRRAAAPAGKLKPKFGDIAGVSLPEVSGNRDACFETLRLKIFLCGQNTNFASDAENREHAGCLPVFRRQAQRCVAHFWRARPRCRGSGPLDVPDFTGFGCDATKTAAGGDAAPERRPVVSPDRRSRAAPERRPRVAPMDRRMAARTGVNLRAGPGTSHRVVGGLATGQEVRVTGRTGDWLRIARPGGGTAFVHGRYMAGAAGRGTQGGGRAVRPSPKCKGMAEGAQCWVELANKPGCYLFDPYYDPPGKGTWSGDCAGGVAVGRGTWKWRRSYFPAEKSTGTLVRGRMHGRWVERFGGVSVEEGPYVDGKRHGRWVLRWSGGTVWEGPYVDGERHGRWIRRSPDGTVSEGTYVNGDRQGNWIDR